MKLCEVVDILDAEILADVPNLDKLEIESACGSDLMSDVLAFTKDNTLLLTGLTNPQVIRTAVVAGLLAVIFVRDKRPSEEMIKMAHEVELPIFCTSYPLYESCGLLWKAGINGCKFSQERT